MKSGILKSILQISLVIFFLMMTFTVEAAIKLGDRGIEVEQLQKILIERGFLNGKADGICGEETVNAIKKFQSEIGLEVDGICGDETMKFLIETVDTTFETDDENYSIKFGMKGPDVEELQNILIALGYMNGTADGYAGNLTIEAITKFQISHGLIADGICGTATFDAINAEAESFIANQNQSQNQNSEQFQPNENFTEEYPAELNNGGYAEIGAVIKIGMHGEGVKYVQQKLIEHGFLTGRADGIAGERTISAIKRFQQSVGLNADGVCGLATYAALEEADYNISDKSWNDEVDELPTLGRSVYVEATAYSPFEGGSRTARGNVVRRGIIAVDPRFIPLGTRVYIPGYGEAVADDTGGSILGNRIDIAFDTYDEAMAFGRQHLEIYILDQ